MYNVSLEIHSPETLEYMQELDRGSPEAAPELPLQMLACTTRGKTTAAPHQLVTIGSD